MRVVCINDRYTEEEKSGIIAAILKVGDDHLLVKEGQEYTVIGCASLLGKECYELEEIDTAAHGYDKRLVFKKERFKVLDTPFEPNAVDPTTGNLCKKMNFYMQMEYNLKEENDKK